MKWDLVKGESVSICLQVDFQPVSSGRVLQAEKNSFGSFLCCTVDLQSK